MLGLSPNTPRHFDFGGGCTRARRSCRSSLLDALETRRRFERLLNEKDDTFQLNLLVLLSKNTFFFSSKLTVIFLLIFYLMMCWKIVIGSF